MNTKNAYRDQVACLSKRAYRGPLLAIILLLMVTACDSVSPESLTEDFNARPDAPSAISDGAHDGTEGFYFLAPMVKNPPYSGTFDPALSPVVEICATIACDALHASFSMTEGTGSEVVRVDKESEHYIVNWHTDKTGTEVGQTYRVRVSVEGTVLGYADIQMASSGKEAKNTTSDEVIGLVDGRTLPIKFRIEEGIVQDAIIFIVSSDGGTFTSSNGAVTLNVPEGAVSGETRITISSATDNLNDGDVVPGALFDFGPSGYNFDKPVTLTIAYDPGNLPAGVEAEELRMLGVVNDEWVQLPGSSVNLENSTVTGPIDGFSRKGVGRGKVHSVEVRPSNPAIEIGGTLQFEAKVWNVDEEEMSRNVQWSSTAEEVATIDRNGVATGIASGETSIEASAGKIKGSTNLTIGGPAVYRIEVVPATAEIETGSSQQFSATVYDQYGEVMDGESVTWTSSDEAVATVDSDGFATGVGAGEATITATIDDVSESAVLTVNAVPSGPEVLPQTISAGESHSCGLTASGKAYCWGNNFNGQLGIGSTEHSSSPVAVSGPHLFKTIAAAFGYTCALTTDGEAYCWGRGAAAGIGDNRQAEVPTAVLGGHTFRSISANTSTCGVTTSNQALCWGPNHQLQLGNGSSDTTPAYEPAPVTGGHDWIEVFAGYLGSCGITTSGETLCWGWNGSGQLGDGTTTNSHTPVLVQGGHSFRTVARGISTCGLTPNGKAYCWGQNTSGELGDGSFISSTSPVEVSGNLAFDIINLRGQSTCGLTAAGTAYCWGVNDWGQLGDNTTTRRNVPTRVYGDLDFAAISAGFRHTCGLTTVGDAYCWGQNSRGELGDGTTASSRVPVEVVGDITFQR